MSAKNLASIRPSEVDGSKQQKKCDTFFRFGYFAVMRITESGVQSRALKGLKIAQSQSFALDSEGVQYLLIVFDKKSKSFPKIF